MQKYKIQVYNQEMTELAWENNKGFETINEALAEAYDMASNCHDIVILMRQSASDKKMLEENSKVLLI